MAELAYWIHADLVNKQIAVEMGTTEGTVKSMVYQLKSILGVRGKVGIALWVERRMVEADHNRRDISDIGHRLAVS